MVLNVDKKDWYTNPVILKVCAPEVVWVHPVSFLKNVPNYEKQMYNFPFTPFFYEYSARFINNIIMIIIISTADLKYGESFYILAEKATKTIVVQNNNCLWLFVQWEKSILQSTPKFQGRKKLLVTALM